MATTVQFLSEGHVLKLTGLSAAVCPPVDANCSVQSATARAQLSWKVACFVLMASGA